MLTELVEMLMRLESATDAVVKVTPGVYPGGLCFRFEWVKMDLKKEYQWRPHQLGNAKEIEAVMTIEIQGELARMSWRVS